MISFKNLCNMAITSLPRIGVAKHIITLLQQQVPLIKWQQPSCSFHLNKNYKMAETASVEDLSKVRPYHEIPGPKPLPIIGNIFRFLPYIGDFHGIDLLNLHRELHKKYGDIVLFGGFPGRRDVVIIYRPEEMEAIFRNEGEWPIRDGMQSMVYYRKITRKDFYKDGGGVMVEIRMIRNEKLEMPDDFMNELFKWSLESIAYVALDKRLGCLAPNLTVDSEPQRMIDAVNDFFETSFQLEMGLPIWKIYPTATWKKFVKALDIFL
ncbi:hypothetical protein J437_LFUL003244, partial [Ladona fulva]